MTEPSKYCVHCNRGNWASCYSSYCPIAGGDFKDAALFECKVSAYLAKWLSSEASIQKEFGHAFYMTPCSYQRILKIARLAVEEEESEEIYGVSKCFPVQKFLG